MSRGGGRNARYKMLLLFPLSEGDAIPSCHRFRRRPRFCPLRGAGLTAPLPPRHSRQKRRHLTSAAPPPPPSAADAMAAVTPGGTAARASALPLSPDVGGAPAAVLAIYTVLIPVRPPLLGGLAAAYAPATALTIPLRCSSTRVSRSTRGAGGQRRGRPNGGTESKPIFSNLSFDCIFQPNRR